MSEKIFSKLPQWFNLEEKDHMERPMDAIITGDVPKWIKGSLYRNGSGLYKIGPTAWTHLFDGFAVLQRWTFQDGKVTYQSSILDSDDYIKSSKRNRLIARGFGSTFPDPCQTLFSRLFSSFVPAPTDLPTNTAINIVEFGDRMFAMTEAPLINEVMADTLKVKGKSFMTDYLALHIGTAHPHILKDGTMIFYGTNMKYSQAYNFVSIPVQTNSKDCPFSGAKIVATVPSRWKMNISYTHSFGLTEKFFVHLEQPLTFNVPRLALVVFGRREVADCLMIHPGESMNILVIDKATGMRTPITYKGPHGFAFHFINCYEDSDHIVCDLCFSLDGAEGVRNKYLDYLADNFTETFSCVENVEFARFVLPLKLDGATYGKNLVTLPNTTATAVLEKGKKDVLCVSPETIEGCPVFELPKINYDYNGVKYRYCYGTTGHAQRRKQLTKLDLQEKCVLTYDVPDNLTPGEPVFIPRPGATKEDDGVIVSTLVANNNDVQSSLVILDAKSFQELSRASLPEDIKMSFTFHGNFTNKTFKDHLANGNNGHN
ncbi:hypothetical protein EGW08_004625 [Elysia chlorotica]|uniref:Uncharacterized protein n=1 Tax=Elysia chlorotica TaxID=188477 RepID=A0A3S0ZVC2_ELYCH|nr:hypothetical protein EGW08_004625 [Elysia chlorotica]